MKETRIMMGMPITVEILGGDQAALDRVFDYFLYVDQKFSTYKDWSEISKINRKEITEEDWSADMKEVFTLSERTRIETGGFFDIKKPDGSYDPSGLVKGWAIRNAAEIVAQDGYADFYIDAGGDIEARGLNAEGKPWSVGIRDPFTPASEEKIVKTMYVSNAGVATSGTYIRGQHIYNPHVAGELTEIVSLTVVGPNVYDADRFATAAFAMGEDGIMFIESLKGFEGYSIGSDGVAVMTSGFEKYL